MVVENSFSNYVISAFSALEALSPINVLIWNKESRGVSGVSLRAGPHLYVSVAAPYCAHSNVSQCH
jgi:hypothetical protein